MTEIDRCVDRVKSYRYLVEHPPSPPRKLPKAESPGASSEEEDYSLFD